MTYWLSRPVIDLFSSDDGSGGTSVKSKHSRINTLIVGSGYGAALAALALSESGAGCKSGDVVVLERGEEYLPQDFPRTLGELPRYTPDNVRGKVGSALWDVRAGDGAVSITGNGLGGTSLVNASVAVPPEKETLDLWPLPESGGDWHNLFSSCYKKIYQLLGVTEIDDPERFAKYRALGNTVRHIDSTATIKAAPVAINFTGGGPHSVDHQPCNHCGNCVIGCHSGAKQSLNMNAWPLAVQRGVELYTGAQVLRLARVGDYWKVYCKLAGADDSEFELIANRVILAAGSIGSTEILSRSTTQSAQAKHGEQALNLSTMLGRNFSANGDGLVFTSGEKQKVNAIADVPDDTAGAECGPTIVGIARVSDQYAPDGGLTVEDGAIPYPLAEIWRETITMQSFIKRFVSDQRSAWHGDNSTHDYIATSNDFVRHGQVLLTMGFDGNQGRLVADQETGNLLPTWPGSEVRESVAGSDYYSELHNLFNAKGSEKYNGGEYHPNPLFKLLPEQFNQVFEGADDIPSRIVTVHPLGGCGMGCSAATGVVNHNGQVFCCDDPLDDTSVYDDLYVLDGAALPGAVGVNPMITISALSYTLASRIVGREKPLTTPFEKLQSKNRLLPNVQSEPVNRDKTVSAKFSERLLWEISDLKEGKRANLLKLFKNIIPDNTKTVVLDVTFYFDDTSHQGNDFSNSLDKWLCNPSRPLRASAILQASDRELLHGSADTFVPMPDLMQFEGTVTLGSRDEKKHYWGFYRTVSAVTRFAYYRTYAFLGAVFRQSASTPTEKEDKKTGVLEQLRGFLRIAKLHTDWRYLEYRLTQSDNSGEPVIVNGRKKLSYALTAPSLWHSLLYLPATISRRDLKLDAQFAVDLLRITRGPSPLQITQSTDEPTSVSAVAGFGLLLTRLIGTTHFWSLGANNYARFPTQQNIDDERFREPPEVMSFIRGGKNIRSLPAQVFELADHEPQFDDNGNVVKDELLARLVRYREDDKNRPAVLLVHGLSHSSEIYWPQYISETYVQYLLKQGYDVWVFDHRTSANTRRLVNIKHTWDDIALVDVPWAVRLIFTEINRGRKTGSPELVHVFSHCIGAGAVAMAVLDGKLQQTQDCSKSMLGSLVPHAVTPWVFSSCENRTRANLWGFVKDFDLLQKIDPRMHSKPSFLHTILDRIASSTIDRDARRQWPYLWNVITCASRKNEYAMAMYFRYTVFWGKQWVHKNVPDQLKKRFPSMVGEVPATILQQTYYCVRRKRLVSKDAENKYVTEQNFNHYWTFPTLFLHGEMNQVFDVESSRLSAFRLARLREKNLVSDFSNSNMDYAQQGVWLHTQSGYGHMDMIIGDEATQKVGPVIDKFFKAAVAQNRDQRVGNCCSYQVFAEHYMDEKLELGDHPLTRTRAGKFPFTGPIVSFANKDQLRIWAEADDYATESSVGLRVTANCAEVPAQVFDNRCSSDTEYSSFHSVKLSEPDKIDASLAVAVEYSGDERIIDKSELCNYLVSPVKANSGSQDISRQRDVDHDFGATVDLHQMPWFNRLYRNQTSGSIESISFAVGSCLHPGLTFSRDLSDSIFKSVWEQAVAPDGIDFLLLVGDQIYADATAGLFDPKTSYERYRMRYREAYSARYFRQVASHVPTYFVVDDHAYRDNYSGMRDASEESEFSVAKTEALRFQSRLNNSGELWSNFEIGDFPFFCFDTRFERNNRPRLDPGSLITPRQARCFKNWVEQNKHKRALFLCTGSPLLPLRSDWVQYPALSRNSDTLIAFPGFLKFLVDTLTGLECSIYLLSGDPHLSCRGIGKLSYDGADGHKSIVIENIVSSPLHAPFPFANAKSSEYCWGQNQEFILPENGLTLNFEQNLLSAAKQQFCRMDYNANDDKLRVQVITPGGVESGVNSPGFS